MQVIKRAIVKEVLTKASKEKRLDRLQKEKRRCLHECDQLDFEKRKAIKFHANKNNSKIIKRFEQEIARRKEKAHSLDFQIEQLQRLPIGTEIVETEIDTVQNINVGDDWQQVTAPAVIVIKDGIVVDIRSS